MSELRMKPIPRNHRRIAAAFALAMFAQGCGGALFRVKPAVNGPLPETAKQFDSGGLIARAAPLLTDEENQELFEANLLLNGILPVRIELVNNTNAEISLNRAKIKVRNDNGEWKFLTIKQTVALIFKANGIRLYNPHSRQQFRQALEAHSLDLKTGLQINEKRQGLVFLLAPGRKVIESPSGLILTIENLEKPIEIKLN